MPTPIPNLDSNNLSASEKRLRLLIEHTPAAIAIFDKKMHYLYVSKRWMEDYHLGSKNIIGLSHYEVFPEIPDHWKEIHKRSLAGETISDDEESFKRADGSIEWVKWELCPWYGDDGKVGGVILFTEVITKRKQTEEALLKMNEILEGKVRDRTKELIVAVEKEKGLNDLKSRFVSTSSHEFRTPLSTISSSLALLEQYVKPDPDGKEAKHFKRMKASIRHLIELLDDFLSLDKLENGMVDFHYRKFNFEKLIQECIDEITVIIKTGQKIEFNYSGPEEIIQDPKIIKVIVNNLLSNASKFSAENKLIRVIINVNDLGIILEVSDEGIGIPETDQKLMFTRLFRARNVTNISGTGLGLNIVRSYIELMKGNISFTSKPNEGTTFIIKLPILDDHQAGLNG